MNDFDPIIASLKSCDGVLGSLVNAYSERDTSEVGSAWVDAWFTQQAETHRANDLSTPLESGAIPATFLETVEEAYASDSIARRLLSLQVNYFRGFRLQKDATDLSAPLTVVDGPNSAGKTSLAEAFEWLFTGQLVRRKLRDLGNPRELEACIANIFRPPAETTWVEAKVEFQDGTIKRLRRLLVQDYGAASTETCISELYVDGEKVSEAGERKLFQQCFAGEPPILMQHTLRLFVYSAPADRRQYFEQLLQLDRLTQLIEKAVVTKAKLPNFVSPPDAPSTASWIHLKELLKGSVASSAWRTTEKTDPGKIAEILEKQLLRIGKQEFSDQLVDCDSLSLARTNIEATQTAVRSQSFPLLRKLRPSRVVDDQLRVELQIEPLLKTFTSYIDAELKLSVANEAAKTITDAELAVARATDILIDAKLVDITTMQDQNCPICEHPSTATLTHSRVEAIIGITPLQKALADANATFESAGRLLSNRTEALTNLQGQLISRSPSEDEWVSSMKNAPTELAASVAPLRDFLTTNVDALDTTTHRLLVITNGARSREPSDTLRPFLTQLEVDLPSLVVLAEKYARLVKDVEGAVGSGAQTDPQYAMRAAWLDVANNTPGVTLALKWERAKTDVQTALEKARDKLIAVRQQVLETRREGFNKGLDEVWQLLRKDRYSTFSQLLIPIPAGKGFPIEIQVKAKLDNSESIHEVDALRVLSESQVHVIGIAAFITRAKLLGQHFLFFDDPVQSMDEDHFRTFAGPLLNYLLDQGLQVVVLTHNDTFARDVANSQAARDGYVSLRVELSRKIGCQVSEGTRRLRNRLKKLSKAIDDGEREEAWRQVRLSIERLYLLIQLKDGPSKFDSSSWRNHTADAMWNESVGQIVKAKDADIAAKLHQALTLSVAGAHDASARGVTDLETALETIRKAAELCAVTD